MAFDWTDPNVISAVSGAAAGAITATFVCPLDVLKTRLQVQSSHSVHYNGVLGGLATILREEGVRGLYRGLTPTLLALLPNTAIYFTAYGFFKTRLQSRHEGAASAVWVHLTAASGAGACTLVTNPLWVVKTRLQTAHMGRYLGGAPRATPAGTLRMLSSIARHEGLAGLYSGLAPSLAGVLHVAVLFPLYEAAKTRLARRHDGDVTKLTAVELVSASAASKMVASTLTYPHEVLRSRMHVSGAGPLGGLGRICRQILQEEGPRGFYRGCLANLVRTTPAAAIMFTTFELLSRALGDLAAARREADARRPAELPPRKTQPLIEVVIERRPPEDSSAVPRAPARVDLKGTTL